MQGCIEQDLIHEAQALVERLRSEGLSVVTAESCTGGLIAACLTHGKQASTCIHGGFIAYTKAHKAAVLGVDSRLLHEAGAVCTEVARQMAEGALKHSAAALSIAVTGVLGPDPDEDGNPPGLVYVGVARSGRPTVVARHDFAGKPPDAVLRQSVLAAFQLLRENMSSV